MKYFALLLLLGSASAAACGIIDVHAAASMCLFGLAVTHPTAVRNAIGDVVVDSLDGAGAGKLVFQTAAAATVATCPLSNPAFGNTGATVAGRADANAITDDTNAVGGTIAKAELQNNAGTAKVLCSVTATGGGGDIQLNSVLVSAAQTVSVSSLTYTAPS